jgi:hypothetical protein
MRAPTNRIISAVLIGALLTTVACSRKEDAKSTTGSPAILGDPLLEKLPTNTAGFAVFDVGGEGYKRFRSSPYAGSADAKESLEAFAEQLKRLGVNGGTSEIVRVTHEAGVKAGLIGPDGKHTLEKVLSRAVLFGGSNATQVDTFEAGLFAQGAPGVDLADKLQVIRAALDQGGLKTSNESIAGLAGFSLSLPSYPRTIYVAANKSVLGAMFMKDTLEGLFKSERTSTLATLQALPEFARAREALGTTADPIGFAFVSLNRLIPAMKHAAAQDGASDFKVEEFPVEAFAAQTSFPKEYVHNLALALSPKTDSQRTVLTALEKSSLPPSASALPGDTAFALSLDTRFLSKIESLTQTIAESADSETAEHVKHIEAVTLGLRNNAGGSPVPDIFLAIDSARREALQSSVENSLGTALALAGQDTKWQTKDVAGSPTRFVTTLIGAGAYLSAPKDSRSLLVGTSEGILKDLLNSKANSATTATATVSQRAKTQVQSANVGMLYLNFKAIATVLESVKNTLAMFTGGNSELNALLDANEMRTWGIATGTLSYKPGVLSVQTTFEQAQ